MSTFCKHIAISLAFLLFSGCGSDTDDLIDDINDVVDVEREEIDRSKLAVNAFFNDGRFGTMAQQFSEVRNTLGIRSVRVLFAWNDDVQPSPDSPPNYSFYDAIVASIPPGVDAIAVLTDVPSWVANSANWSDGSPISTFAQRWVAPTARRYAGRAGIRGFQVWNEPNFQGRTDNVILGLDSDANRYIDLLTQSSTAIRSNAPGKLVVSAATTAINQNYPQTLDYNRQLRDGGVYGLVDVFAIHYYGRQLENVVRPGGVGEFLSTAERPIWVTESGAQGVNEQLRYVEEVWPFLSKEIPKIERFYYYQMYESTPPQSTYALRNLSADLSVSDLYVYLRDGTR